MSETRFFDLASLIQASKELDEPGAMRAIVPVDHPFWVWDVDKYLWPCGAMRKTAQ